MRTGRRVDHPRAPEVEMVRGLGSTTTPIVVGPVRVEVIDHLTGFAFRQVVGGATTTDDLFDEAFQLLTEELLPLGEGLKELDLLIRRRFAATGFPVLGGSWTLAGTVGLTVVGSIRGAS